jgi:hypothetical protein
VTEIARLTEMRDGYLAQLAAIAGVVDMSENGRSVSVSGTRASITAQLDWVNARIALLSGPFEFSTRMAP